MKNKSAYQFLFFVVGLGLGLRFLVLFVVWIPEETTFEIGVGLNAGTKADGLCAGAEAGMLPETGAAMGAGPETGATMGAGSETGATTGVGSETGTAMGTGSETWATTGMGLHIL